MSKLLTFHSVLSPFDSCCFRKRLTWVRGPGKSPAVGNCTFYDPWWISFQKTVVQSQRVLSKGKVESPSCTYTCRLSSLLHPNAHSHRGKPSCTSIQWNPSGLWVPGRRPVLPCAKQALLTCDCWSFLLHGCVQCWHCGMYWLVMRDAGEDFTGFKTSNGFCGAIKKQLGVFLVGCFLGFMCFCRTCWIRALALWGGRLHFLASTPADEGVEMLTPGYCLYKHLLFASHWFSFPFL